jgi:hypothetical protein
MFQRQTAVSAERMQAQTCFDTAAGEIDSDLPTKTNGDDGRK